MPPETPEIDLHPVFHELDRQWRHWWHIVFATLGALVILFALLYWYALAAPSGFPSGSIITIKNGESVPRIASDLATAHIIKHPRLFAITARLLGGAGHMQAGPYLFKQPQDLLTIVLRLIHGASGIPLQRITLYEGETIHGFASIASKLFPLVSASDFLIAASSSEGYLFPDTYEFAASATAEQIVDTLRANFDDKILTIQPEIVTSGHSLDDIVTLASIVQAESDTADMRVVAGILWTRIKLGMPLQVDAVPSTYKKKGLPIAPVDNPGLDALSAAANPVQTKYLFYLTGKDGMMHYAVTYAQHLANIKKYL